MQGASNSPETRLREGAGRLGLDLSAVAVAQCLDFVELLLKWGRVHNLTATRDAGEIVTRHLLDSLTILPLVRGQHMLDIGSGAGFPALPLAIARPDNRWVLIEARQKRASFLEHVIRQLQLTGITVINGRVEDYRPQRLSDTLVVRAFAPLPELLASTRHLWHARATVIAMKGKEPFEELKALPKEVQDCATVVPLAVPGLRASRHAVVFSNLSGGAVGQRG